jgi:hypothetical protein
MASVEEKVAAALEEMALLDKEAELADWARRAVLGDGKAARALILALGQEALLKAP